MKSPTRSIRWLTSLAAGLALLAPTGAQALPPIRHVFVVVLENESYAKTFGRGSAATYLSEQLVSKGQLLRQYFGIAHQSNPNYIAMISGQGPNPVTQADCLVFNDLLPGIIGADGQAVGAGCVYGPPVATIANQLEAAGLSWRGYMEDIGNSTTEPKTCRHPPVNSLDMTQSAHPGDQYALRHDPFVYFHSIIDNPDDCAANVVGLDRLPGDLRATATTPNYSLIVPNLCHDGHDQPCVDGQPGGLTSADLLLRTLVPQILASPAYRSGGLLVITFDEASNSDASSCCGERSAGTPNAGAMTIGPGGGRVGAVLLSPWIRPSTVNDTPYNHYSLLRSTEDLLGLGHLGYAAAAGLTPFGADVFNGTPPPPDVTARGCTSTRLPRAGGRRYARGSVIGAARVVGGRGDRRVLELSAVHAARVRVDVTAGGRTVAARPRRVRACRTYRIELPRAAWAGAHGRARVVATVGAAAERRFLRF